MGQGCINSGTTRSSLMGPITNIPSWARLQTFRSRAVSSGVSPLHLEQAYIWSRPISGGGIYLEEAYIWSRPISGAGIYLEEACISSRPVSGGGLYLGQAVKRDLVPSERLVATFHTDARTTLLLTTARVFCLRMAHALGLSWSCRLASIVQARVCVRPNMSSRLFRLRSYAEKTLPSGVGPCLRAIV